MTILKINRVPVSAIRVLEYPEFANAVVEIVEKHNPDTLKIQGVTNLLKEQLLEVDKISVKGGSHPMTKELINLRSNRDKTLGAILSLMQGYKKALVTSLVEAGNVALPFLDKFLSKIHQDSNFVKNKKIDLMFAEMDGNTDLEAAMQTLGFTILLDELKSILLAIRATQNNRRKVRSETPRVLSRKAILNATTAMNNLFKTIEINQLVEQNVDYTPLVSELNQMLSEYKSLLTQRLSLNSKSAAQKMTVAPSPTTSATAK